MPRGRTMVSARSRSRMAKAQLSRAARICGAAILVLAATSCGGGTVAPPPPDDDENDVVEERPYGFSDGDLVLVSPDPSVFASVAAEVRFVADGAVLSSDPEEVIATVNGFVLPAVLVDVDSEGVTLKFLIEGRNDITVLGLDDEGLGLLGTATIWAGAATLAVQVIDDDDEWIDGATVVATLGDDHRISTSAETVGGVALFGNVPDRSVILDVFASDNRYGSLGVTGHAGTVTVVARGFAPPSPIDNNDFSLGLEGWELDADGDGIMPVTLIEHVPGPTTEQAAAAGIGAPAARVGPGRAFSHAPAEPRTSRPLSDQTKVDLMLSTHGEGPQSISRTFETSPGTATVSVRYRFITSEVPGGWFGTEFDDYFSVAIRSLAGGGFASESNSMNGLGLGAFDANGATAWREVDLPVSPDGDQVQVDITVANVADDLYDSQVVVEIVEERTLSISALALHDIDGAPLRFLSASPHTYFDGNTRVHGTVAVEGDEEDALSELRLEVLEGGSVVATAQLAAAAGNALLQPFGSDGRVEIASSQLLYEISSAQFFSVDQDSDGVLVLRLVAESANGESATREFGGVEKLVLYGGSNRYSVRNNAGVGGDSWVKPSVNEVLEHFRDLYAGSDGLLWGEMSNMNGGPFPRHRTHQTGNDVDGFFTGYRDRDAAVAEQMLAYLNDPEYGSRIHRVFVTFQRVDSDSFWTAIRDVTLDDGRSAREVIRRVGGHTGHFHWVVTDWPV
jgi:hypothetical protein